MRRKDRLITDSEALNILANGEYGILSTISSSNTPYGVPLNYCCIGNALFFHCALEGQKVKNIQHNSKVSFCVVGKTELLPDQFGTLYESCIVQGTATESIDDEKQMALEGLIQKYSTDFVPEGMQYIDKLKNQTKVFKIEIESISGKART